MFDRTPPHVVRVWVSRSLSGRGRLADPRPQAKIASGWATGADGAGSGVSRSRFEEELDGLGINIVSGGTVEGLRGTYACVCVCVCAAIPACIRTCVSVCKQVCVYASSAMQANAHNITHSRTNTPHRAVLRAGRVIGNGQ
jgi:hypothetical protein